MGIQALSGAAERETNFIYVCYDNEAYMNTGVQRSSATPAAPSPPPPPSFQGTPKKDFLQIMEAHHPAYLASACSSYPGDIYHNVSQGPEHNRHPVRPSQRSLSAGLGLSTKDTIRSGGSRSIRSGHSL